MKIKNICIVFLALAIVLFPGCTKTKTADETTESSAEVYESYEEAEGSGDWWIQTEYHKSQGISLLSTFQLEMNGTEAQLYDRNGTQIGTAQISWEQDSVIMHTEYGDVSWDYDENGLYNSENGEMEFMRTEDPGFPEIKNYDGKWVQVAAPNDSSAELTITGRSYHLTYFLDNEELYSSDVDWELGPSVFLTHTGEEIELAPSLKPTMMGAEFFPVSCEKVLFGQRYSDYECFALENEKDDPEVKIWSGALPLLNGKWEHEAGETTVKLYFYPNCFQMFSHQGETELESEYRAGSWEMTEEGQATLNFTDGTSCILTVSGKSAVIAETGEEFIDIEF